MVKVVTSSFNKGKFEQDFECSLNTFGAPKKDAATTDQGRPAANPMGLDPAQMQARDLAAGSATTPNGTGTTAGTGFGSPTDSVVADAATTVRGIDNAIIQQQKNTQGTIQAATGGVADGDLTGG